MRSPKSSNEKPLALRDMGGYSLLDLMIGMAISLLALFAIQSAVSMGVNNKRIVSEALDAEASANMAMAQLESEIKSSGYGVSTDPFLGCNLRYWRSGVLYTTVLNPITIAAGTGPGGSDIVTMARSRGETGFAGSSILTNHAANDTSDYQVANRYNFGIGDQGIVADGVGNCGLLSVTALPSGGVGISWSGPPTGFPFAVTTAGSLMNTGPQGVSVRAYQIDAATQSKLIRDEATDGIAGTPSAEQVVYMKAFYGKDPGNTMQATLWDQTVPATSADWKRVLAVRVAVVARSQAREAASSGDGSCSGGNCPTPASIALWPNELLADGTTVAGPTYSVSAANQHYRHVVRTMVIPLRNNIWNNN